MMIVHSFKGQRGRSRRIPAGISAFLAATGAAAWLWSCSSSPPRDFPIKSVALRQVQLEDDFWSRRLDTNRSVTIPYAFQKCAELGRIDNFAIAGGLKSGQHRGIYPFDDSDIYKIIEGASYSLILHPDPALDRYLDSLITIIAAAQEDDGYLFTCRTNNAKWLLRSAGATRWSNLQWSHELYNAGHLYEAAVAHFQATGKRSLLEVAIKNANLINMVFGPEGIQSPPGHEEIEIGLARLYCVTSDRNYLELAKFFLDQRGHSNNGRKLWGEYAQDHLPILEQREAVGHAVRQAYMNSGLLEVAALTGDSKYALASERLWESVVGKKLYVTGGLGAVGIGERFSTNYDLPNLSAYQETCASIANVMWNQRLFLLTGEAKYVDVMERTLYNALLAGVAMSGDHYFYPNPLASRGYHERSAWFDCPCCISNLSRFMPAMPGYIYAYTPESIFVNLFVQSRATIALARRNVQIEQETRYPWDGGVKIIMRPEPAAEFELRLRIPGWAQNTPVPSDLYRYQTKSAEAATLRLNGEPTAIQLHHGYACLRRVWKPGDTVELNLPMPARRVVANERVQDDLGKVALQRGPIVYCVEWPDHPQGHVLDALLPDEATLTAEYRAQLLGGVTAIGSTAYATRLAEDRLSLIRQEQKMNAIPYYAWAHRGTGEMAVWIADDPERVAPLGVRSIAARSLASSSGGTGLAALNDQFPPRNSRDLEHGFFSWSPGRDTVWVQYDFHKGEEVSAVNVYWLAGKAQHDQRPPKRWRILANIEGKWEPVYNASRTWGTELNRDNSVIFETVRTNSLRLEAQLELNSTSGILEWEVY